MKDIHLGENLVKNRRSRGITQDELAEYMGVSRAAVSKWETSSAYPDIFMLPKLAAYFGQSIDSLIGYEPQMEREEIRKWYRTLSEEFASLPFSEALAHCRELIKKYYSCCPLLFQMGALLVNHAALAGSQEEAVQILEEGMRLFRRAREKTEDPLLGKDALQMEAWCQLVLGHPEQTLELIGPDRTSLPVWALRSSACQMLGDNRTARQTLQAGIYQETVSLLSLLTASMGLFLEDPEYFSEVCSRTIHLADTFCLEQLHPGIMFSCYIKIAEGWAALGRCEQALDILERYTALACGNIYPLHLHGDSFFDLLDDWLKENTDLGDYLPRSQKLIRTDIARAVTENPCFSVLAQNSRFQSAVQQLKRLEEESL